MQPKAPLKLTSGLAASALFMVLSFALLLWASFRQPHPGSTTPGVATQGAANLPPATSITWESSFESAHELARQSGKPLMVDFYADWCGPCRSMDSDTYTDSTVMTEARSSINVKVNVDQQQELASRYSVDSLPTIIWFDANGNTLERISGGYGPGEFLEYMRSATAKNPPRA